MAVRTATACWVAGAVDLCAGLTTCGSIISRDRWRPDDWVVSCRSMGASFRLLSNANLTEVTMCGITSSIVDTTSVCCVVQ